MKEKQIYVEGYKKPYPALKKESIPTFKHFTGGFECVEMVMMKAGVVLRGEKRLEFQDFRVYLEKSGEKQAELLSNT